MYYLPGIPLPTNIVAVPDVSEATKDANILVFVLPHQVCVHVYVCACVLPHTFLPMCICMYICMHV